jgi:hypothetical protein
MTALVPKTLSQKQTSQPESQRYIQLRVSDEMYEDLRRLAFERRTSRQVILIEAIKRFLAHDKGRLEP